MQVYAGMVGVLFKLEAEHGRIDVIWGIVIWIECWRKTTVPCESRTGLCWQFYAHWLHPRLWKIDRWTVGMRHTTFISVEVVTILAVMFIRVGHSVWQACWANLSVSELHTITGAEEPLFIDFQSNVVLLQVLDKLADMDFTDDEVDSSLWGAWLCTSRSLN